MNLQNMAFFNSSTLYFFHARPLKKHIILSNMLLMYYESYLQLPCWIKYSIITEINFRLGHPESAVDMFNMFLFSNKQIIHVLHDRCFMASSIN